MSAGATTATTATLTCRMGARALFESMLQLVSWIIGCNYLPGPLHNYKFKILIEEHMFLQEYFLRLELALICSFCFWVLLPSLIC